MRQNRRHEGAGAARDHAGPAIATAPVKDALTELLDKLIAERLSTTRAEPETASPWLTVNQAATRAQVSTRVIYAECRRGKLRHARVGGRREIRLRAEWIDAWLEASAPQEVKM
jgi:excisionase family DNA binding protein